MAIKRIPCGGFFYDDETIEFDGKVISAKGGGSGGGAMVVDVVVSDTEPITLTANKTISEILTAYHSGVVVRAHMYSLGGSVDMWLDLGIDVPWSGLSFGNIMYSLDDEGDLMHMYMLMATKDEDTGDDIWRSDLLV